MKFYNVQHNTPEWDKLRIAKITASVANTLLMLQDTKGYNDLISQLAYELLTWQKLDGWEGDKYSDRGHEREEIGAKAYEEARFVTLRPGGFYEYNHFIGASPDRNLEGGHVEIKTRKDEIFLRALTDFKPSRAEVSQCQFQMLCSEKDFVDLVYTPPTSHFYPIIHRIRRDQEYINKLLTNAYTVYEKSVALMEKWKKTGIIK